jgi:uncharacterized protein with PIN domain
MYRRTCQMSEENNNNQGAQVQMMPELPQAARFTCTNCQEKIVVKIPRPRILNTIDCTVIAFAHERLDKCPKCQSIYVFAVSHFTSDGHMVPTWAKVEQKQSSLIAPTEKNIKETLQMTNLNSKVKQ